MTKEELETRICEYFGGRISADEARQLLHDVANDKNASESYERLSRTWGMASMPGEEEMERNLRQLHRMILRDEEKVVPLYPRRHFNIAKWVAIAACFVFIALNVSSWMQGRIRKQLMAEIAPTSVCTPHGVRTKVKLPDGSSVVMNSSSNLSYYDDPERNERTVSLQGEATFDVKHNTEKPFVVHTDELNITVLGTKFNVNAYNDDDDICVALIRGKVALKSKNGKEMILLPNEEARYNRKTGRLYKNPIDATEEISWHDGNIHFKNATFASLVSPLRHQYGVNIEIKSKVLHRQLFTGSFDGSKSINEILQEINVEKQFRWVQTGNTFIIYDNTNN